MQHKLIDLSDSTKKCRFIQNLVAIIVTVYIEHQYLKYDCQLFLFGQSIYLPKELPVSVCIEMWVI
jgi:hypothetical protein